MCVLIAGHKDRPSSAIRHSLGADASCLTLLILVTLDDGELLRILRTRQGESPSWSQTVVSYQRDQPDEEQLVAIAGNHLGILIHVPVCACHGSARLPRQPPVVIVRARIDSCLPVKRALILPIAFSEFDLEQSTLTHELCWSVKSAVH